jgi:carboxyl-terminal processing protease
MGLQIPSPSSGRAITTVALVVVLGALVGSHFSDSLSRVGRVVASEAISSEIAQFEAVVSAIEASSADASDLGSAVMKGAIPQMLANLDPHSQFFEPTPFVRLREEQAGTYAGVGMQIVMFEGSPIVEHPFPETPAFQAGVRPGDAIRTVDGQKTRGRTIDEVVDLVRGLRGTAVRLGLERDGQPELVEVDVIRDTIPRPTIPLAFLVKPGIGFIQISSFGETTAAEFDAALKKLNQAGLEGLVVDLRDNHGGLLTAGVHVAGQFLEEGALVVSHRGRASRERRYYAEPRADNRAYPMTILVDCRSASAAEIVAGALQDHDRALIVGGSNTFGKGLVQSVLQLPQSAGMVLTTARYYTPSGRLIQRDYDEVTLGEYYADPCSETFRPDQSEAHLTDAGRVVYSGSGITPDARIDSELVGYFERDLINVRAFDRFANRLLGELDKLPPDWDFDANALSKFRNFAAQLAVATSDGDFRRAEPFLRRKAKQAVYTAAFHVDEGAKAEAELDPAVLRAVALLLKAAELRQSARPAVTQARLPRRTH